LAKFFAPDRGLLNEPGDDVAAYLPFVKTLRYREAEPASRR